jgi:hypothetical protein
MGGGPPGQDQGPLDLSKVPQPLRDILGRQDKAVASLMPPRKPSLLSPEEQQAKYQAMTRDTTWATTMAATATDPAAKYWLGLIGKYGWTGIKDYLVAMQGGGP